MRALTLLVIGLTAFAKTPLTVEKTLDIHQIGDLQFQPGGTKLLFRVSEPIKGVIAKSHLWLYDSRGARQLTWSAKSEMSAKWSPDGKWIAFLSNREETNQIYILSMDGGEARPLTKHKGGVNGFVWSPDGKQIAFLAKAPKDAGMEKREQEKDDARLIDDPAGDSRLWTIDAAGGNVREIPCSPWSISEMQWLPTGILAIATEHPHSEVWDHEIVSIDPATGKARKIARPIGPFSALRTSPDFRHAAFLASRKDGPSPHDLWLVSLAGGKMRNLSGSTIDRTIGNHHWIDSESLIAVTAEGTRSNLRRLSLDGTSRAIECGSKVCSNVTAASDGGLAWVGESPTELPELWVRTNGQESRVTTFNDTWKEVDLRQPETIQYKSFDGKTIEALLLRPREPSGRLIVLVHGGPTGRWQQSFEAWGQLLASRGYAVFYPSIRGSTGYGSDFLESNRNDWGGGDFKDLPAGVDYLIQTGDAKPDRLGIGGWSYGGYMAAWAITQTNRFKAAVAGAGLSDLASEFGTENGPAYDEWFFGTPYENLANFTKSSPITFIKNATTPTLILQGENDTVDPIGQSQQLHLGLKRYRVPSDFVVYPREGHAIREEKHRLDQLNRIVAWFEKYLPR